jgi:hypothetical protein
MWAGGPRLDKGTIIAKLVSHILVLSPLNASIEISLSCNKKTSSMRRALVIYLINIYLRSGLNYYGV